MTTAFYIVVNAKGNVELRKTPKFDVPAGHVATRIEVEIPDEAFEPVPLATVRFVIPPSALRRTVEAEVSGDIEEPL